jgi:hypothetical protein
MLDFVFQQRAAPFENVVVQRSGVRQVARYTCDLAPVNEAVGSFNRRPALD